MARPRADKLKPIDDRDRALHAERMAEKRAAGRDIDIPKVVNPRRKKSAAKSLKAWKRAYFGKTCYFKSAPFQDLRLAIIEEHIKYGGQRAQAHPRGSAKTTDAVIAATWALMTGRKKFFFIVCATEPKARTLMGLARDALEFNDVLCEDYPEVCVPIRALGGAAQRAGQQTVNGVRTRVVYQSERIILPTIEGSAASGGVLASCGIMGNINGQIVRSMRPDFVLLDDIETPESALSQGEDSQCEKITNIVNSSIGGLAGPGVTMAILWNGTILERGCCIETHTNRKINPQWRGSRQKAIEKWPERMDLWDEYCQMVVTGIGDESDPFYRGAMKFYRKNRKEMNRGAKVAWPSNFNHELAPDGSRKEISALQHLFHQKIQYGDRAFMTQYQNEPPIDEKYSGITAELVASRLNEYPWQVTPEGFDHCVVQMIDVRGREIHYLVLAYSEGGSSAVIDYGIDKVFAPKGNLRDPDSAVRPALEQATLEALRARRDVVKGDMNPYRDFEGRPINIAANAVDARWLKSVVCQFVVESGVLWRGFMGDGKKKGNRLYTHPTKRSKTIIPGDNWYGTRDDSIGIMWHINADQWKLHSHERWLQDPGTAGAVSLPGVDPRAHTRLGKHIVAEEWSVAEQKWEEKSQWNHWLDCHAGACALGNMCGIQIVRPDAPAPRFVEHEMQAPMTDAYGRPFLATQR